MSRTISAILKVFQPIISQYLVCTALIHPVILNDTYHILYSLYLYMSYQPSYKLNITHCQGIVKSFLQLFWIILARLSYRCVMSTDSGIAGIIFTLEGWVHSSEWYYRGISVIWQSSAVMWGISGGFSERSEGIGLFAFGIPSEYSPLVLGINAETLGTLIPPPLCFS